MPRTSRKASSTGVYHIIARSKKRLFVSENDTDFFFNALIKYFYNSELYAYRLEEKTVHLVFKTNGNVNSVIKPFLTCFARYHNRTYLTTGELFYDRFISEPLESIEDIGNCIIFLHSKNSFITSLGEYTNGKLYCSTDYIERNFGIDNIINNRTPVFFHDDYAALSDRELKAYILFAFSKNKKDLSYEDKRIILECTTSKSNLAKTRVCKIFDINSSSSRAVKKEKNKPLQSQNRELSVWLL